VTGAARPTRAGVRRWGPPSVLLLLLALAGFAYLFRVGDVPSASGDEGNWMSMGHRILLGLPTRLGPDSRFVTTAFARMISLSFRFGGVTIGAARATLGVSVLLGLALVYAQSARMKSRSLGLALVSLLALHPWTVWWCRSVVVPYPIALMTAVLGPLAWLHATDAHRAPSEDRREAARRVFALLLAGQILVCALHMTPFGVIPLLACALWSLASVEGRRSLRTPGPWVALLGVILHALPIAKDAATVVGQAHPGTRLHDFERRASNLVRSMIDGLSGEQTLRDYVGDNAYDPLGATPTRAAVLLALCAALWLALRGERPGDAPRSSSADAVRRFAPMYLLVSLLGLPLVLAPARDWWLATIDSERYLFVLLAPASLLLASAVLRRPRSGTALCTALLLYFALGPNVRAARYFWRGGGPDHGYFSAHRGGGYRGYKVLPGPRSMTVALYRACLEASRGERMTIAVNDYAFHPVRVLIRVNPDHHLDAVYLRDAVLPPGRLLCIAVWPEAMFTRGHIPGFAGEANHWTRAYVRDRLDQARQIASWTQPNGAPLLEIYTGRVRAVAAAPGPSVTLGATANPATR
jgi:hypothetical protein